MCDTVNIDYIQTFFPKLTNVSRVLEVGSYNVNGNCKAFIEKQGIPYLGCDIKEGPDVDLICDMTKAEDVQAKLGDKTFDLIICMNVLEHVFRPIDLLDNMKGLLNEKGYLLVVVPLVWDLHDYPADFYRLNPDFFMTYGKESKLDLLEESMLFSLRNNRQFFSDIKQLPLVIPDVNKSSFVKFFFRKFSKKYPELKQCFCHTYLNLIFHKK